MKFEGLSEFDWFNEPENVVFGKDEMKITARACTDFWQSKHHGFFKDDGHLFYAAREGDFSCLVKWSASALDRFNQAGLMVRFDAQNWFKMCAVSADAQSGSIATFTTRDGYTDWAETPLLGIPDTLWYKLVRYGDDFTAYYSTDGKNFIRLRRFYLSGQQNNAMAGAYICAPQNSSFSASLEEIQIG